MDIKIRKSVSIDCNEKLDAETFKALADWAIGNMNQGQINMWFKDSKFRQNLEEAHDKRVSP